MIVAISAALDGFYISTSYIERANLTVRIYATDQNHRQPPLRRAGERTSRTIASG